MISQQLLNKVLAYFILLLMIIGSLMFYIFAKKPKVEDISYKKNVTKNEKSYDIISKALFLTPFKLDVSIPSIKDELEIFKIEKRPDCKSQVEKFKIKFKTSSKILKVSEEDPLYISVDKNGNFEFSDNKAPLMIYLKAIDTKSVKIIIEADLIDLSLDRESQNITNFFIASLSNSTLTKEIQNKNEFQILAASKWFDIDEFLKIYQKSQAPMQRLEIAGKVVHLKLDDMLIFYNGEWQKLLDHQNTQNYPIAKIKSFDNRIIEIEAFDEMDGKCLIALPCQPKQRFSLRFDQLITSVRKRTISHLSCQVEKQRVILKPNDILIKREGLWRLQKKDIDFDEIRNEELFYFEKIENKNNKDYLIGYFFNSMRTNFQRVEVPILSISKQRNIRKR